MKLLLACALPLLVTASATAATEIAFGPVRAQPGESIRIASNSESKGGTVQVTKSIIGN